jgi:hypothetical protein
MSHITKTREEVLSRGTFNEDEGTFTFDNLVLKDALLRPLHKGLYSWHSRVQ